MSSITPSLETEVLVIGGGPVGLSLGLQFARAGVRAVIAERRETLSRHPKANGIFSRTMEAFRQWGVAGPIADIALPPRDCLGFAWLTRINGIELGRIMFADTPEELVSDYSRHSPEIPRFAPQDRIEQLLADEIATISAAEIRLGAKAVALDQDDSGVNVTLQRSDGAQYVIRARYVVGADGSRSSVKALLGLSEEKVTPWGESLNIYFESAELDALRAGRPYQLWWVVNADVRGAFWPVSHRHRWVFTPEAVPGADLSYYTAEVCADLIRKGAGTDVELKVISSMIWQHEMGIAHQWRSGRVFLAGDAAHRFPPHGGFGMNSGIQDAHNLGWKLIAVLQGYAGERLLDSYECERKPVAEANAAQTLRNTELIKETGWFVPNPGELAVIEQPEGQEVRERISAAVLRQSASIHSQGQQFGAVYTSDAVVPDGTVAPASSIHDYLESASPGARAPHLWIEPGLKKSIQDLVSPDRLTLLICDDGRVWREAVGQLPVDVAVFSIGGVGCQYQSDRFQTLYGLEEGGAVLIRPDGHVAWRSAGAVADPVATLHDAVSRILSCNLA